MAWSPDGLTLASGVENSAIQLWDVASGQCKATLMVRKDGETGRCNQARTHRSGCKAGYMAWGWGTARSGALGGDVLGLIGCP